MKADDEKHMQTALDLARKGYGRTSPNPMVGAVLVKGRAVIGKGWHRCAGGPHAEVEAIRDAERHDYNVKGATLYVTLEPCCTTGRTPPCTDAIQEAGIKRVVVGATDPNPKHAGRAFRMLRKAGIEVRHKVLQREAQAMNEAFNHWVTTGLPWVTVKAAMTLDGKIATESGESKWITGEAARRKGIYLRKGSDAILVGVETVLADNPSLLARGKRGGVALRRMILDSQARTPMDAQVVSDDHEQHTTVVVLRGAPAKRVAALKRRVNVLEAPARNGRIDLRWLLKRLGKESVTSLLVEGGGEVNGSFLQGVLAQRIAFFYASKILGGSRSRAAVGGEGVKRLEDSLRLQEVAWERLGSDLMLTARVVKA